MPAIKVDLKWACLGFLLAGLIARAVFLFSPIDYDEAYTYLNYSSQPFLTAVGNYNLPNNHLLNSFLTFFTSRIFGGDLFWIRLPSLLFGLGSLTLAFSLFQKLTDRSVAFLTVAALAACSPIIFYSTHARGYIHQVFFVMLFLWGLLKPLSTRWLVAIAALAMWALPTTLYPMAGLFLFFWRGRETPFRGVVGLGSKVAAVTALLYLPAILSVVLFGTKVPTDQLSPRSLGDVFGYLNFIASFFVQGGAALTSAFLVFFFLSPILNWKTNRALSWLWIGLVVVPAVVILITRVVPPFQRSWIWLAPFFFAFTFQAVFLVTAKIAGEKFKPLVSILLSVALLPSLWWSATETDAIFKSTAQSPAELERSLSDVARPGDFLASPEDQLTLLAYSSAVRSGQPMRTYLIAGDWAFSLVQRHAEPAVLRKNLGAESRVLTWQVQADLRPQTEALLRNQGLKVNGWDEVPHSRSSAFKIWLARLAN